MSSVSKCALTSLRNLDYLGIRGNPIIIVEEDTFAVSDSCTTVVEVSIAAVCCFQRCISCLYNTSQSTKTQHHYKNLLHQKVLKYLAWTNSILGTLMNSCLIFVFVKVIQSIRHHEMRKHQAQEIRRCYAIIALAICASYEVLCIMLLHLTLADWQFGKFFFPETQNPGCAQLFFLCIPCTFCSMCSSVLFFNMLNFQLSTSHLTASSSAGHFPEIALLSCPQWHFLSQVWLPL